MSPVFDLLRFSAALLVCIGHARGIFATGLAAPPPHWMQQAGVNAFFLLSGFLISQTLRRRLADPASTFRDYAIDRWSRIYSGFIPAIILVAIIDWHGIDIGRANSETIDRYSVGTFLANIFMLQAPNVSLPFGSAAPFWSVAIEFWIYLFVGLTAFSVRDGLSWWRILAISLCGIIPVSSLVGNNMVFVPWLLGAAIERAGSLGKRTPILLSTGIFAAALFALFLHISADGPIYTWKVNLLMAAAFAGIIWTSDKLPRLWSIAPVNSAIFWCAGWSYSLYLLHHSIMIQFASEVTGSLYALPWMVAFSILASIIFAGLTEAHHKKLASYLKSAARSLSPRTASTYQATRSTCRSNRSSRPPLG
jgi:peptidoglycan/LPS O-acetylase OafA/YrhL